MCWDYLQQVISATSKFWALVPNWIRLWSLYEIIHICTVVVDESEEWSSQLMFQFEQLERRSLKKIRASRGLEPVTSAIPVRCSTNWAMKPHIGSEVNLLSSYLPVQWNDVKFTWNNWSPDFFSGFFFPIAQIGTFTAMITLHFLWRSFTQASSVIISNNRAFVCNFRCWRIKTVPLLMEESSKRTLKSQKGVAPALSCDKPLAIAAASPWAFLSL